MFVDTEGLFESATSTFFVFRSSDLLTGKGHFVSRQ